MFESLSGKRGELDMRRIIAKVLHPNELWFDDGQTGHCTVFSQSLLVLDLLNHIAE